MIREPGGTMESTCFRGLRARSAAWLLLVAVAPAMGCVTVAEFRKLEYEVNRLKGGGVVAEGGGGGAADLGVEVDELRSALAELSGRLDVAEHNASQALEEARLARGAAHTAPPPAPEGTKPAEDAVPPGMDPQELASYREAQTAWREGNLELCVDRFRQFLQTYPSSAYADDAAYWMADCHYKQDDYKTAILRFNDVVGRYPSGDKAADALYRQGEALLRLGPSYNTAARQAFERLINEYPDSPRVPDAQQQLQVLGSG